MAKVTGRVFVTVGGKRLASKEGAKLMMGGFEREPVIADTGVIGYSEKIAAPGVECTIAHTADTSLEELRNITNASLSFDTDTGKSFVLSGAWCANALELEKGEVKLNFGALECKEV
jgi:hypothetical protein